MNDEDLIRSLSSRLGLVSNKGLVCSLPSPIVEHRCAPSLKSLYTSALTAGGKFPALNANFCPPSQIVGWSPFVAFISFAVCPEQCKRCGAAVSVVCCEAVLSHANCPGSPREVGVAFWIGLKWLCVLLADIFPSLWEKCVPKILPLVACLDFRLSFGCWAVFAFSEAETACQGKLMLKDCTLGLCHLGTVIRSTASGNAAPVSVSFNSYLPGRGDTMIKKVVHPGRGPAIAHRLC